MKMRYKFFIIPAAFVLTGFLTLFPLVDQKGVNKLSKADIIQTTKKIQIPQNLLAKKQEYMPSLEK